MQTVMRSTYIVSQVGSSGLIAGPFRTPIEPCTYANFNFNYTFGAAVALDKIWLITDVISHLFGALVLDKMIKRFIRRWSNGIYSNANTGAGKLLPHGMIAGNPIRKRERADAWQTAPTWYDCWQPYSKKRES